MVGDDIRRRAARIRLLIFDVDGVLTDGRLLMHADGSESKAFHVRDGLGIRRVQRAGITCAIISGRRAEAVAHRARELEIDRVYQGVGDKGRVLDEMLAALGLMPEQVAYVGDDVIDLPVMHRIGLAVAVADAEPEVLAEAHWRTDRCGGQGAAREVCELILAAQAPSAGPT